MPKHSTKAEREDDTRYLFIYKWELESPAYRVLTGDQVRVYLDMRIRYNGQNNGAIKYRTRRAAEVIHKHNATGARALERLIELGFIKVTQDSSYGQKKLSREFELTAIARTKAKSKTKVPVGKCDFMKWTDESIKLHDENKELKKTLKKEKDSCTSETYSREGANPTAEVIPIRA